MATKGRDLKVSFLTDLDKFVTDKAADGLDAVADASADAGRALDKLDTVADTGKRAVADLATEAKDTAKRVDEAFDKIAKSSRAGMKKVDDNLDRGGEALDEFKDEARASGRETAASFGGGFDDIADFVQETAANAFGGFGPLGAAAGIAAAAGIGIITKVFSESKEKAEEAKASIGDWVDAFVEGQGRITEAKIGSKLQEILGDPDQYREIIDLTDKAGISAELYARALAGDAAAVAAVKAQIIDHQKALSDATPTSQNMTSAIVDQQVALQNAATDLGIATGATKAARDQWLLLDEATRGGITADVKVNAPTAEELDAINRRIRSGIGTIVIPVKAGQSRFENNANNSRYRD